MNYAKAMDAHLTWIGDVWDRVERGEALDPERIGRDDLCEVGRWLHGEGIRHAGKPEYESFRRRHAQFHACVGRTVRRARSGKRLAALKELETGGACVHLSDEMLEAAFDFFESIRIREAS
jgi:hypothetical protein